MYDSLAFYLASGVIFIFSVVLLCEAFEWGRHEAYLKRGKYHERRIPPQE